MTESSLAQDSRRRRQRAAPFVRTIRDFERFLRDAGFSKMFAKIAAGHGFRAATTFVDRRDVDNEKLLEATCHGQLRNSEAHQRALRQF